VSRTRKTQCSPTRSASSRTTLPIRPRGVSLGGLAKHLARVATARSRPSFDVTTAGEKSRVVVAASTVAIVAIAAAVIVVALLLLYVLPRGGRRRRPPRT
jgi:hypothetical protein